MFSIFPKDDKNQTLRIKRFLMSSVSYFMSWFCCALAYYLKMTLVPFNFLVLCLIGIFVIQIFTYVIIRTGLNKRFKDPSLTIFQMVIAIFWVSVIGYYADEFRSLVFLVYVVIFLFGIFRLNVRQLLFLSAYAWLSYSAVVFLAYKFHPEHFNKSVDIFNIGILALLLPWISIICGYTSSLRAKISNALSTNERLTNNIQDVIFVVDMNLKYTYVSPSVKIMRGYESEEVIKQTPSDAFAPSSVDAAMRTITDIIELEKSGSNDSLSRTLQLEIKRKDGATVWTETKFSLVRDKHEQTVGILGVSRDITERRQAEERLQKTLESLKKAVGTTIQVLVAASESRDRYTAGHQYRSANLACAIAEEMGLPQDIIEGIQMAGIVHDIGKLSIPTEILTKPTKLTTLEFSLIKEHSYSGYEMLKNVESPWPLAEIVYQHHERMDGSGYPRKLKGDEILLEARIMAVADVVEAMASHRPYRPALGLEAALKEIEENKGILYDDIVSDTCLKLFREKGFQLT